jgi:putative membrane protein
MARLLLRLVVLAVIIGAVAKIVPGIHVHGSYLTLLWLAVLLSILNAVVGTVLKVLSFPLILLTLGVFLFVVNAAVLGLTANLSKHLDIDSFGSAFVGALLITFFGWLAEKFLPISRKDVRQEQQKSRPTW